MVLAKREGAAAIKGRTKVLSAAQSAAMQPSSTSNELQRITPPLTEIAAQAVIGQDVFIFICKRQGTRGLFTKNKNIKLKSD